MSPDALAREMRELRALANQDPLTSLPNRRVLLEALDLAMKLPPVAGCSHAIFLLDLNDFKCVNDRYGHAVGDEVLQAVVERFRRVARGNDVFARLGGDEFAVLSRNVDEHTARTIGNRFIDALNGGVNAGGVQHTVGVAIGAALYPRDGQSVEKVLRLADVAMYRAKAQPGSSLVFFDAADRGGTTAESDGLKAAVPRQTGRITGLPCGKRPIASGSTFSVCATMARGVCVSHSVSETSAKYELRNTSR